MIGRLYFYSDRKGGIVETDLADISYKWASPARGYIVRTKELKDLGLFTDAQVCISSTPGAVYRTTVWFEGDEDHYEEAANLLIERTRNQIASSMNDIRKWEDRIRRIEESVFRTKGGILDERDS